MSAPPRRDPDGGFGPDGTELDLLSFATHEMGNQLTVIGGFAEMLADGAGDLPVDTVEEFSQAILRSAEQMRTLLQSISDLRRVERGGVELHLAEVDLVPLVARVVDQWRPQLDPRRVAVDLPESLVTRADPARIRNIVVNLLSNVARFTPAGARVEVALGRVGGAIELSVADDGPGIPPEDADELFERRSPLTTRAKGTGIGLYVSRHVARAHGGDLVLVQRGPGARLVLRLPAQAT